MTSECGNEKSSSGGDSSWSTTGNVSGIVTFFYAVAAGLWLYVDLARRSSKRSKERVDSWKTAIADLQAFGDNLGLRNTENDGKDRLPHEENMRNAMSIVDGLANEFEGRASWKQIRPAKIGPWPWYKDIGRRLRLLVSKEDLDEQLAKIDGIMDALHRIQHK